MYTGISVYKRFLYQHTGVGEVTSFEATITIFSVQHPEVSSWAGTSTTQNGLNYSCCVAWVMSTSRTNSYEYGEYVLRFIESLDSCANVIILLVYILQILKIFMLQRKTA